MRDKYKQWVEKYSKKSIQKNDFVHMKTGGLMSAIQTSKFVSVQDNGRYMSQLYFYFY